MTSSRVLALAFAVQLAVRAASECPPDAKPFPSSLSGVGKKNYADLFEIQYEGTYKVVKYSPTLSFYNNWHPDDSMKGQEIPPLVLYQCGTTPPSFGDAGVDTSEIRFFQIPVQKATLGWGGPLPFFELLSLTEAIQTIDLSYISSPCSQLLEECVPGVHVHARDSNWTDSANASQVIFTDSFGTGWGGPDKDIPFQISLDPGSLQRAEWIRFVSAFFNEEDKADAIFTKIETDYKALKALGLQLSTDACTEWAGKQPKVLFVSLFSGFIVNNAHYKRDFVQDGGGRLVPMPAVAPENCSFSDNTDGSKTLTCKDDPAGLASFKTFLAEADVIIDENHVPNYAIDTYDFSASYSVTAQEVPALARNPPNIFRLDGTISDTEGARGAVGSSWFEAMPSQPQQLLAGIMEALWSDDFESPCGFKFLRRAIQNQGQTVLGDDDCPYHDAGGSHDCAGMHNHLHDVPECSVGATIRLCTTTTTEDTQADGAMGFFSSASALAAIVAFWCLTL